jgi:hypothetical protein
MWGGFDLSAVGNQLGALGSQLGDAIQKAKQEVETTIEGFEGKGDDYVATASSSAASWMQPVAETDSGAAGAQDDPTHICIYVHGALTRAFPYRYGLQLLHSSKHSRKPRGRGKLLSNRGSSTLIGCTQTI